MATPEPLARKILDRRNELEGERKQVTVLFGDVKGSMELQERLDPEDWAGIMDRLFRLLADGVHRFDGTVDKFTGDGIMALFGAPIAHEDHARRACHAALHLADAVAAYAEELRRTKGLDLHLRIGLNSGEVIVGRIGDDLSMEYTALGPTVGLAQRMEAAAQPGRVYLTEHTAALVSGHFALDDVGLFEVKGVSQPVRVFALERAAGRRHRPHRSVPLVGREHEMTVLLRAAAQAETGRAQVVGIVGEAGVGKSRLCEEFAQAAAAQGTTVRRASGVSHARSVPLLPILELFRDYFGITDGDPPDGARQKIAEHLIAFDPGLEDALPLVFDFLEVPDPERPPPRLGPEARLRRLFEIIRRVTRLRSGRETLMLLVEDLHWFDLQSVGFLEQLLPSLPGSRTLVVANFRPEFHASWMAQSYYRQLPLSPLDDTATDQLVARLLGPDASVAAVATHVVERTGGNPFFVEEVVRALVGNGTLEGELGRYRLARTLDKTKVPPTVQATLAARIDRLGDADKRVLQVAAVIGRTFPPAVLHLASGRPEAEVEEALTALCSAEFLQEESEGSAAEYRFWHPLTQEVAYGSLLAERRARLHGAVARAIVKLDPGRLDERAALVATHFERAGDHLETARWNARAAAWAVRGDVSEAMRRWRAVVEDLAHCSETEETLTLALGARVRLLQWGARTGMDPEEARGLFVEGRNLAERLGDLAKLIGIIRSYGAVQYSWGRLEEATTAFLEVAHLGDASGDSGLQLASLVPLPLVQVLTGRLREGLDLIDRAIALAAGDAALGVEHMGFSPIVRALVSRAELLGYMGRIAEARHDADRAVAIAQPRSEVELVAWALSLHPRLADHAGEEEDSLARATESVRITNDSGNLGVHVLALEALGIAQLLAGRHDAAAENLGTALGQARRYHVARFEEASILAYLARTHLGQRDEKAARLAADEAVAIARARGTRVFECFALLVRAKVLQAIDTGTDTVLDDLRAALALVRETGAVTYEPMIRENLGRLRADAAELREALRLFTSIDATGHSRRLEARLAASGGPPPHGRTRARPT